VALRKGRESLRASSDALSVGRAALHRSSEAPTLRRGAVPSCRDVLPSVDHAAASGFDHAPAEPETCSRPRTCRPIPRFASPKGGETSRIRKESGRFVFAVAVSGSRVVCEVASRGRGRVACSRSSSMVEVSDRAGLVSQAGVGAQRSRQRHEQQGFHAPPSLDCPGKAVKRDQRACFS
jgi:hypothetical protein